MLCLSLVLSVVAPENTGAQDKSAIMAWKTEFTLRTYLLQEMHQQNMVRRSEIDSALISEERMAGYRDLCRKKYIRLLGEFPASGPLNAIITKRLPQNGYSVEDIIFESRPAHHVTANLYLPDERGRKPAVLMFCGHEMTSKATESYQKTAILFALNGFVVLVVDPISQGEMVQFTDSSGVRILRGSTTEHTILNAGANLTGSSVVAWELYDNIRALDYLTSRPEVDADRIGCLGNSGGGTQTTYFIAFDERIKVAAPCSYIARRERNFELTGAADGCQHLPYEGAEHLEIADFLIMFAPKPLFILAGRYDFVDYTGTVETYKELCNVYSLYKENEKLSLFTFDDGHGISKPKREAAVEWFIRWLRDEKTDITEGNIQVLDEASANCTPTGQLNSFFHDEKNVQEFSLQAAKNLSVSRDKFLNDNTIPDKQLKLRELLSVNNSDIDVNVEVVTEEHRPEYLLTKLILRRDGEIPIPCMTYIPNSFNSNDTVIIWLNEAGKSEIASNEDLILKRIRPGNPVILSDLRGMGETAEKPEANDWKYYNREYHNAMLGLHIGRPLPGQRVEDIMTILKYLEKEQRLNNLPVKIIATGAAVQPALFAAVLTNKNISIEASSTIRSYFEILEKPMEKDWYSYIIPGVLKYFDLPDLMKINPELKVIYK